MCAPFHLSSGFSPGDLERLVAEHRSCFERAAVRVLPNESHHNILAVAVAQGLQFLLLPEHKRAKTLW